MNEHWVFGANDNDWVGWGTTAAYLVSVFLCFFSGRLGGRAPHDGARSERGFWWCLGTVVLLLGINKQLDLQTLLIDLGRETAKSEGWYGQRRVVQWLFIAAFGMVGFGALLWLGRRSRQLWREYVLALCGIAILLLFVMIRAAPVHADRVLNVKHPIPGKRHLLELAGIVCVGISAGTYMRKHSIPMEGSV
jgi:hypothetical protein